VASVRTLREIYDKSLARTAFTLVMLGIAGAMALLLGVVGSTASSPIRWRRGHARSGFGWRWEHGKKS